MDEYFRSWVKAPDSETNSFWRAWLSAHPQKAAEVEEARQVILQLSFPSYKLQSDEVGALWRRIQGLEHEPIVAAEIERKIKWWQWAAAAVILVTTTLYFIGGKEGTTTTYETAFGETKNIILPDQSTVVLNANSKLSFADSWEHADVREVRLEGEAYFSVTHQQNNQPFQVKTKDGVAVEVLGTTFNVYHRIKETKVVLNSGKISLSLPSNDANKKIIMKPGELVEYSSNQVSKKNVNPENYVAWTQNKLVLDHTSLREMVQMLNDNYGLQVEVMPKELLDQTVSGSMPAAREDELVEHVAKAFRLTALKEGKKVIITE
jgi:ferric-dicitrate binding protein FerR (iron transport regulator)